MNYKVMQRPMFRLGGGVIKGKKVGNRENFQSPSLEDLFKEKAELRQKAYGSMKQMLPFSVLASQMDDIRTIRKPGDILNILSNIGGSEQLMGALSKLPSIDLKMKEGELKDKIALEQINIQKNKKTATELKLKASADARSLLKQYGSVNQMPAEVQTQYYDLRNIATGDLTPGRARTLAVRLVESDTSILGQGASAEEKEKKVQELINSFLGSEISVPEPIAEGGRVGLQQGTPNPMVMPQPKPQEAVQDRQLDTLMDAAPALEDPNQAKSMGEKDMYNALRRRLPKEISDDVVRLIAYNQEAFADFANISDQSDVESFNQKYNVELVLPVGNQ